MDNILPRLRDDLDLMPSPAPDQPGLLIRDPCRYTDALLIVPPVLIPALSFLDGTKTVLDLQAFLTRHIGQIVSSEIGEQCVGTLRAQCFLKREEFEQRRDACQTAFRNAAERPPVHAGSAYPLEPEALRKQLDDYMGDA